MRPLFLILALSASSAWGEDLAKGEALRELEHGAGAVRLQEGHALLLDADGHPKLQPVKLPSGVFYTAPGHARLTAAFLQLQADKLAAQARADALSAALALRTSPPGFGPGTGWLLGGAAALFLAGCVVGFTVAR